MRPHASALTARLIYWGPPGAGVSSNLRTIHAKLKAASRGELTRTPTRLDPTVVYEVLPISLGEVNGVKTQLELVAVPGSAEQAPTRKQLLDAADGVVFVADARPENAQRNAASLDELREFLHDYGRHIDQLPVVVQYNKRDLSDAYSIEAVHRELGLGNVAVFEAVATEGTGVLPTLTTLSKRVVRMLSEVGQERRLPPLPTAAPVAAPEPAAAPPAAEAQAPAERAPAAPPPASAPDASSRRDSVALMEAAILEEGEALGEVEAGFGARAGAPSAKPEGQARIGADLRIVSVGQASVEGRRVVRVPLVLGNDEGETVTLALTLALDPLLDGGD